MADIGEIDLKSRLRRGEPTLVVNVDHPSAGLVEHLGRLGVGAVFFDCEQGSPDIETIEHMARAARLAGTPSLVRVWSRDAWMIERMLLRGVDGIVVPRVDNAETAQMVVDTVRYVLPGAHREKCLVVQIESRAAIDALDEILAVEGIDAFFIGPVDLSKSYGFAGAFDGPEMALTIDGAIRRIASAGKAAGMMVDETTIAGLAGRGVPFLYCHANDFLRLGLAALRRGCCQ